MDASDRHTVSRDSHFPLVSHRECSANRAKISSLYFLADETFRRESSCSSFVPFDVYILYNRRDAIALLMKLQVYIQIWELFDTMFLKHVSRLH